MEEERELNLGKIQIKESTSYIKYEVKKNFAPIKQIMLKNEEYAKVTHEAEEKRVVERYNSYFYNFCRQVELYYCLYIAPIIWYTVYCTLLFPLFFFHDH